MRTSLRADIRQALRSLTRSPLAAATVILTLALGLGLTTAIFSVVNAVMLRPLPFAQSESLVRIYELVPAWNPAPSQVAAADYQAYSQSPVLRSIAAYSFGDAAYSDAQGAAALAALRVTPSFLDVLGVRLAAGRSFDDADAVGTAAPTVIITNRFWTEFLGSDPRVVGRSITINALPRTVIGILPAGFRAPEGDPDLLVPLDYKRPLADVNLAHKYHWLSVVGRLDRGVTIDRARAALTLVASRLTTDFPESNTGHFAVIMPLRDSMVGTVQAPLLITFGAVALVLLIACANVANVMLARTISRRRELAVRGALGASRGQLMSLVISEALILSVAGGTLGAAIALSAVRPLLAVLSPPQIRLTSIHVDAATVAFAFAAAVLVGLLCGAIPAVLGTRGPVSETIAHQSRGGGRGIAQRLRASFVGAQIALAMILLVGAGLMLRTIQRLDGAKLGFDADSLTTFSISLPGAKYSNDTLANAYFDALQERLAAIPGVQSAALGSSLPLVGRSSSGLAVAGHPELQIPAVAYMPVSPGYFRTLRIPVVSGREFDRADGPGSPRMVIVNQALARRLWPSGDATGQRIVLGPNPNSAPYTIVGVVGDVATDGVSAPTPPTAYTFTRQDMWGVEFAIVRGGNPATLIPAIRRAVKDLDATLPIRRLRPMTDVAQSAIATQRFAMLVLVTFGGVAVVLAAIGVYGVIAYTVTTRLHEFGVRLALGAQAGDMFSLVLVRGMRPVLVGVAVGAAASLALTRFLSSLLFETKPIDAPTFGLVAAMLVVVAAAASYAPARLAAKADPLQSLREE